VSLVELAQVLGGFGEVVGAVAVVVTLVYLSTQIRQNTSGLRASAYQTWVGASTAHHGAGQADPVLARTIVEGTTDPAKLDETTSIQFAFWCHQFVLITEATYHLHRDGIISDSVYEKELERAMSLLESPGGSQWWNAGARTQYSEDFVAALEAAPRGEPSGGGFRRYKFTPGVGFQPMIMGPSDGEE